MRCISFVIFLTFSCCFVVLPALENVTQADEIEVLERKLEYLRAKKELDLELEIVKAKLQKLNQDYSDVVDTKTAVSASSTSESPETSEPSAPAKVEEAPTKAAQGADHEWVATDIKTRVCRGWTAYNIKIDEDGTFSFDAKNPYDGWKGHYKGNLRESSAKFKGSASWLARFEAEQANGAWQVNLRMAWSGGGCEIKVRFE